jgi:hypothetical protein
MSRFLLFVRDAEGREIEVKDFLLHSLGSAARLAHSFQRNPEYVATILDQGTDPPKRYYVDAKGAPVPE